MGRHQHAGDDRSARNGRTSKRTLREKGRFLLAVARASHNLHRRGVSHGDLRLDNILVGSSGALTIIDFDRATIQGELLSAWRDWVGISFTLSPYPLWKTAIALLQPRLSTAARRARQVIAPARWEPAGCEVTRSLAEAWTMAAAAPANAAGQGLAYYAFTFQGQHYYGERPWYLRWEAIRRAVDFRGKTVVELGCNMGLLATFSLVYGAQSSTGATSTRRSWPPVIRLPTRSGYHLGSWLPTWTTTLIGRTSSEAGTLSLRCPCLTGCTTGTECSVTLVVSGS